MRSLQNDQRTRRAAPRVAGQRPRALPPWVASLRRAGPILWGAGGVDQLASRRRFAETGPFDQAQAARSPSRKSPRDIGRRRRRCHRPQRAAGPCARGPDHASTPSPPAPSASARVWVRSTRSRAPHARGHRGRTPRRRSACRGRHSPSRVVRRAEGASRRTGDRSVARLTNQVTPHPTTRDGRALVDRRVKITHLRPSAARRCRGRRLPRLRAPPRDAGPTHEGPERARWPGLPRVRRAAIRSGGATPRPAR